ncbi:hypothetical protein [Wolbachia endosymbiont (group A) of Myopa testacea]|uniref:hypothetical protein n=1 Tax=Wolbachia endosymbiont (group A) of Myopa testacea TaxID=3066148 RepID=UPI003132BBF6
MQSVGAAQNVRAGISASFQPMERWSLPFFYAQSSDISVPRFQPPTQLSSSGPSSWKGAAKNVQASTSTWTQPMDSRLSQGTSGNKWQLPLQLPVPGLSGLSWKGANESTSIGNSTWCLPSSTSFLTTRNDLMSSSLGVFADSPSVKGKESIFSVEPEKQQVTDKSVQGACGGSPKKQNKIQQFFRDLSIRHSKSNGKATKDVLQFDKETFSSFSPGMQKVLSLPLSIDMIRNLCLHLPIGRREELIILACSEKVKKSHSSPEGIERLLSSLLLEEQEICSLLFFPDKQNKIYVDLSPGARKQVVLFWEVLRGRGVSCYASTSSEESGLGSPQNLSIGDKLGNMLSKLSSSIQNLFTNPASPTHKGVPGGLNQHQKEELYKVFSPKMKKKLVSGSLPLGYEKLLYLLYVDKREVRLLLSNPKAKEQVCSVLPPEKMEQVQSDSTEEILCLLQKLFSDQEISDGFLISSKVDSPKSEQLFAREKKEFL